MENDKKPLRGELIGARVEITESRNKHNKGMKGTIIDETKNMLVIRTEQGDKKVIKTENKFTFTIGNKKITAEGEMIARRPEERIKEIKKNG